MNTSISHDDRLSFEFIPAGSSAVPATTCCQTASRTGFSCLKPAIHNSKHHNKTQMNTIHYLFHLPKLQQYKTLFSVTTVTVF
jgi:hypothetical protein